MKRKTVSFPRELHPGERRTMIAPNEVPTYRDAGFDVFVEKGVGLGASFQDEDYANAGAKCVSQAEAWGGDFIVKYKGPEPEEYQYFRPGLTIAASFHAEGQSALIAALCEQNVLAYSLEYFVTEDILRPIPFSDMEITGKLAFIFAAYHLQTHFGGSGTLLSHVPGARTPKVVIIGYGNVGGSAARAAASFGCDVTVLGSDPTRLRKFAATMPPNVKTRINSPEVINEELPDADLVIGAILIATDDMPGMITRDHLKMMRPGSMVMDVTCGSNGGVGWMPTFTHTATHENPVYEVDGILHCKIDRIPSRVPRTATEAKSFNIAPYIIDIGNAIAVDESDPLAETGILTRDGQLLNQHVIDSLRDVAVEAAE